MQSADSKMILSVNGLCYAAPPVPVRTTLVLGDWQPTVEYFLLLLTPFPHSVPKVQWATDR
jgi:hypothetical protein